MRSRSRRAWVVLLLGSALLTAVPALPAAAERISSDFVLIRSGDVVGEDLYAAGNDITIEGRIEGDLVASAWGEIRISGEVTGDVIVAAGSVVISGTVGESVRVVASRLVVEGEVGNDVVALARRVEVDPEGAIGEDLVTWAWETDVGGAVGGDVEGNQRTLTISGSVSGNVGVTVNRLVVGDGASIDGTLRYRSDREAQIGEASVGGSVIQETPLPANVRLRAVRLLTMALVGVGALLFGLTVVWASPARSLGAARALRHRPLRALGYGALVVAAPVLIGLGVIGALFLLSPETGAPLALVLVPFFLGAASIVVVAALFAPVPVAIAGGRLLLPRRSVFAAFLVGAVTWLLLALLPYVGSIVTIAGVVLGLGAWLAGAEAAAPDEEPRT